MAIAAIITADIVNSTRLTRVTTRRLADKLRLLLDGFKYEFYRGDSFQVYIKDPGNALFVILQVRAAARSADPVCDVRASVGIGATEPNLKKLSIASGEAFTLSGRSFDEISKTENRLMMQSFNKNINPALRIISYFVDYIFKNLTSKQAEVLLVLIADNTQSGAAKKLRKSQSTINKHAQSAGWYELVRLLNEYEGLLSNI